MALPSVLAVAPGWVSGSLDTRQLAGHSLDRLHCFVYPPHRPTCLQILYLVIAMCLPEPSNPHFFGLPDTVTSILAVFVTLSPCPRCLLSLLLSPGPPHFSLHPITFAPSYLLRYLDSFSSARGRLGSHESLASSFLYIGSTVIIQLFRPIISVATSTLTCHAISLRSTPLLQSTRLIAHLANEFGKGNTINLNFLLSGNHGWQRLSC